MDYVDDSIRKIWDGIPKQVKITFAAAFILGLLIHLFMLTNKLPNHDDIGQLFDTMNRPASGRWFLSVPASISSTFSMPWVNGILIIAYISLAACFVVSSFRIKRPVHCVLISALMVSFPAVACTLSYMNSADGYFFSLLLACAAAYMVNRYRFGFLISTVLLTLSLGIYQAYYSVAAAIMVVILLLDVLKAELTIKQILYKGVKFVSSLALSILFYFLMVKITTQSFGLTSYMGLDKMGQISLSSLPSLTFQAYKEIAKFFLFNSYDVHFQYMRYAFILLGIIMVSLLFLAIKHKKIHASKGRLLLFFALLALLPLASSLIVIMSQGNVHFLMIYGFLVILLAIPALLELCMSFDNKLNKGTQKLARGTSWAICLILSLCVYNYGLVSNQAYFKLHLAYEQGYAYSIGLVANIQSTEGYTTDKTIVFVGKPSTGAKPVPNTKQLNSMSGIISDIASTYNYTGFLNNYLGYSPSIISADIEKLNGLNLYDPVDDMATYPNDNSIQTFDDYIIIKFENLD